jgi:hypothetical protein
MRCPNCKSIPNHFITDVNGKRYFSCSRGLTAYHKEDGQLTRVSHIIPCDTVTTERGKLATASIAFVSDNSVRTIRIENGKVQ